MSVGTYMTVKEEEYRNEEEWGKRRPKEREEVVWKRTSISSTDQSCDF